jgi:hypothetical protein
MRALDHARAHQRERRQTNDDDGDKTRGDQHRGKP